MNAYTSEESINIRSLDRSPYRNMPAKCIYCAYASKPSSSGSACSMCSMKNKNSEK